MFNRATGYLNSAVIALFSTSTIKAADSPPPPPVARGAQSEARGKAVLQNSTNEVEFFRTLERAIREKRIEWLVAAAKNPNTRLKIHTLSTIDRLPRVDHCRLWSALLAEGTWEEVNRGLNERDKTSIQRIFVSQSQREIDDSIYVDLRLVETRARLRDVLHEASLIPEVQPNRRLSLESKTRKSDE